MAESSQQTPTQDHHSSCARHLLAAAIFLLVLAVGSIRTFSVQASPQAQTTPTPTLPPTPTFDTKRLAKPAVSDGYAQQLKKGSVIYWGVCMACHGDKGQGLTDEWRDAYGPEDRNCWQKGCHGPDHPDNGFLIPKDMTIPAVAGPGRPTRFKNAQELHDYIFANMPWWDPGQMTEEEAWQTTAYILKLHDVMPVKFSLSERNASAIITQYAVPQPGDDRPTLSTGVAGSTYTVTVTVTNQGETMGAAAAVIYLSPGSNVSVDGGQVGLAVYMGFLSAGGSWNFSTTITIPKNVANGSYYLGVSAMGDDPSVQGNNVASQPITITGGTTCSPDAHEADNTSAAANVLAFAVPQQHNHCEGTADWLRFDAAGGTVYGFSAARTGSKASPILSIYGTDGVTLLPSTSSGTTIVSRVTWTAPANGTYYVKAAPWNGISSAGATLVRRARRDCDFVAASIFVNPTQFAPGEDFKRYPRTLRRDLDLLRSEGCDLVFEPPVTDMYPPGFDTYVLPGALAHGLEGAVRPGHFRGVATVCLKLFTVCHPHRAYFGATDYQQALLVRKMALDLNLDLEFILCPTLRDADGLALSSRNRFLTAAQRRVALALPHALAEAARLLRASLRTNLTFRELAAVFQISRSCVHRIVVSLVTLIPTRDHTTAAKSKNDRWSCNAQVLVRRRDLAVIATSAGGPGNRNDVVHNRGSIIEALSIAHGRTLADGGYRGVPELVTPVFANNRIVRDQTWRRHRRRRARVEHALARLKDWRVLRDHRRRGHAIEDTMKAVAMLHNLRIELRDNSLGHRPREQPPDEG